MERRGALGGAALAARPLAPPPFVNSRRRFLWRHPDGRPSDLVVVRRGEEVTIDTGGGTSAVDLAALPDGRASAIFPSGRQVAGRARVDRDGRVEAWVGSRRVLLDLSDPLRELASGSNAGAAGLREIRAQIPGRVVEVRVHAGDRVPAGTTLLILEAMKMQNEIRADSDVEIASVDCVPGQAVDTGAILVRLEPPAGTDADSSATLVQKIGR
jgi:biotin carboxyl carrier protein